MTIFEILSLVLIIIVVLIVLFFIGVIFRILGFIFRYGFKFIADALFVLFMIFLAMVALGAV